MQIIPLSGVQVPDLAQALQRGQTLVYPTETCYGIGCDATNSEAVEKVFAIKGRDPGKSVLMLAASIAMVRDYAEWGEAADRIADKYWPGPLTIILPVKSDTALAPGVIRADGTVAFRVSAHPFCTELAASFPRPIVSTSANLAGEPVIYASDDIIRVFGGQIPEPDIVIDGGVLPERPPSTIIRLDGDTVTIVRQGDIIVR